MFLVKYNADGKTLWVKEIFDSSQQSMSSSGMGSDYLENTCLLAMDSIGHCYVSGTAMKPVDLGNNNRLDIGPYIVSFDTAGNILWAKNIGKLAGSNTAGFITFSGIAADKFGSIYITGSFYDSLSFENVLLVAPGYSGIFIAKFNNAGKILWAKKAGSDINGAWDGGYGISVQSTGENSDVFIMGNIGADSVFFDDKLIINRSNSYQIFLAKYNGQGVIQWVRSSNDEPGISCSGSASSICSDSKENVYLCGNFQADSGFFGDPHIHAIEGRNSYNQYHAYLVKFNGQELRNG